MADRSLSWTERTAFHDLADEVSKPRLPSESRQEQVDDRVQAFVKTKTLTAPDADTSPPHSQPAYPRKDERRSSIPITADYLDLKIPNGSLDAQLDSILDWVERHTQAHEVFIVDDAGLCVRSIRATEKHVDAAGALLAALREIDTLFDDEVETTTLQIGSRFIDVRARSAFGSYFALCVITASSTAAAILDLAMAKILEVMGNDV